MLALTLALAAGFRTQSLRAAPRRSSALSASKRVAVCGPSGGTVADGIAARLAAGGAEVVRVVDGEGRSGRVDAAVCCGDGVPGFDKGFSDPAAVATKALGGAARTACVVLHGPLFGGVALEGELQAFKSGLLKEPVLEDDFGRRGARVAVMREAQGVAAKPLAATRRGAVADAVVAALASPELKPGLAKFEVRSAAGEKALSADDWAALLAEVLQAGKSTKALASRLDARYDWAPEPLSSWLCGEWGPTALRSVDATLAIRGARPVAFVAPADPSSGQLGALRWEALRERVGPTAEFVAGGGLDLVATRDRIDELTGEADLMDLLVDALGNAAARAAPSAAAAAAAEAAEIAAANAASIIELTQGADESEGDAAGTRCGLADLVDDADAAFTAESEPGDRASMWDATTGRPTEAVAALRKRVAARLGALDGSCGARGGELRLRAALALVNSCLVGRSANFKVERTTSDDFADLLGPWFAPGVGAVLLLAVGGFLAAFDALVRVDLERDVHGLQNVLDEARHLQALRHDHIVAYYDTFVHREDGSNGLFALDLRGGAVADYACIAMEDCAGGSLLDHVASGVPFPLPAVVEVTRQCATGLAYAHAQGVVHRDIKLENVFVLRGTIKIGDFGLAVAAAAGPARSDAARRTLSTLRAAPGPRRRRHRGLPAARVLRRRRRRRRRRRGASAAGARGVRGVGATAWAACSHEVATSASLPSEPPFLGMLLLEDDADRHAAAIAGRCASSLAPAALVEGQKRRQRAVAGLEALLAALFAVKAADRPRLADVARLGCLGGYASFRLEEFFAFTSLELSPAAGRASTVSKRSRMLRAKSLPRCGGRGADSPAPRAPAATAARRIAVPGQVGRRRPLELLSATLRYRATSSPPRRRRDDDGRGLRRRRRGGGGRRGAEDNGASRRREARALARVAVVDEPARGREAEDSVSGTTPANWSVSWRQSPK
ncbi:kinase kinase kinase [Aureococcus anophagefferens]|nr:kinase kinase kinase [Aureococcus anophagefferens]